MILIQELGILLLCVCADFVYYGKIGLIVKYIGVVLCIGMLPLMIALYIRPVSTWKFFRTVAKMDMQSELNDAKEVFMYCPVPFRGPRDASDVVFSPPFVLTKNNLIIVGRKVYPRTSLSDIEGGKSSLTLYIDADDKEKKKRYLFLSTSVVNVVLEWFNAG